MKLKYSFLKTSTVAALGVSLLGLSSQSAYASNPPGGNADCDSGPGPCGGGGGGCDDDDSGASDDSANCPTNESFAFSVKVGAVRNIKSKSFHSSNRLSALEGRIQGKTRSFEDFYNTDFSPKALHVDPVRFEYAVAASGPEMFDPALLKIFNSGTFEQIDREGYINQVLTDNAFGAVEKLDHGFHIRIWLRDDLAGTKTDDLYDLPVTDPLQEVILKAPEGIVDGSEYLYIFKYRPGTSGAKIKTRHFQRDEANDRTVYHVYEGEGVNGPLVQEITMQYGDRGAKVWDYSIERITKQASVDALGNYGVLKKIKHNKEFYRDSSNSAQGGKRGARRRVKLITDFGGENLTEYFDYYDDPNNPFLNGRMKTVIRSNGSWEHYEYQDSEGSLTSINRKYSSWKDVGLANFTQAKLEETIFTADEVIRTTSIDGVQIEKGKISKLVNDDGETEITKSSWTGSEWASSVSCFYSDQPVGNTGNVANRGQVKWIENADGTAQTFSYQLVAGETIVTKSEGEGDRTAVTAGETSTKTYNSCYQLIGTEVKDIESDLVISSKVADLSYGMDGLGRPQKWIYNGDPSDYSIEQRGCCGLEMSRSRDGKVTTYLRDIFQREYQREERYGNRSVFYSTERDGLEETITRTADGEELLIRSSSEDLAGLNRTTLSADADGDGQPETSSRTMVYGPLAPAALPAGSEETYIPAAQIRTSGVTTTSTNPDGSTSINEEFLDGQTESRSGTAAVDMSYSYDTHALNGGGLSTTVTQANGTETMTSYSDQLGRSFRTEYPDGSINTVTYNDYANSPAGAKGQMASSTDADGVTTSYGYNAEAERTESTESLADGQQRITLTDDDVVNDSELGTALRNRTWLNGVRVSTSLRSQDGYRTRSETLSGTSKTERTVADDDGDFTMQSTANNGSFSIQTYEEGLMESSAFYGAGETDLAAGFITKDSFSYDGFGRRTSSTDGRGITTTINSYLPNGAVVSVTDGAGHTTAFSYDNMGRRTLVDAPDSLDSSGANLSNITYTSYYPTGQTKATWGAQTYARFYLYDEQNRMTELRTYQNLAFGVEPTAATLGFAKTNWNYDPQRGWLNSKRYDDGTGPDYSYTPAGRLATRQWARTLSNSTNRLTTSYSYDSGQLETVQYNDTDTKSVNYTYDNFGRIENVTQGTAGVHLQNIHDYAYDPATLQLTSETIRYDIGANGIPALTKTLDRSYDALLRPQSSSLGTGSTIDHSTNYSYDTAGRLATVSNPQAGNFTYGYLTGTANLLESVTGPAHKVINTYEPNRNILDSKVNSKLDNTIISSYDYSVNSIGQRTNVARTGSAFAAPSPVSWGYDPRGQVTNADHTNTAQDQSYNYDGIGNRNTATVGTNTSNYTANALNQYSAIGSSARSHDQDGNLLLGDNKNYLWNAENRLISHTNSGTSTDFQYDYLGRRYVKTTSSDSTYTIYDGWNPIADYNASANLKTTRTWGRDLSGSMQGAGGVGGLLAETQLGTTTNSYYPSYDGNGNVSEYLTNTGSTVAHYEYDAFGNTTNQTGTLANNFEQKFSTKRQDTETGLYYYGYRYYDPVTGRWPSRDPMLDYLSKAWLAENEVLIYVISTLRRENRREFLNEALKDLTDEKLDLLLIDLINILHLPHEIKDLSGSYGFLSNQGLSKIDYLGLKDRGGSVSSGQIANHCEDPVQVFDSDTNEIGTLEPGEITDSDQDWDSVEIPKGSGKWLKIGPGASGVYPNGKGTGSGVLKSGLQRSVDKALNPSKYTPAATPKPNPANPPASKNPAVPKP